MLYQRLYPLLQDLCWHSLIFFAVTVLGYFAAAGSLYWALYLRPASGFAVKGDAIAQQPPEPFQAKIIRIWASVRSDIVLSVQSSAIFAGCAAVMTTAYEWGLTRIYLQPEQYGLGYLAFSLVLVLLLQDAYFYFTHRLSHHPKLYKWLHQGHHHSKNPTPWTAFAFDPAEAMIQAIYLIGVTILIPIHLSVLIAVVLVMTIGALLHHFGVRLFAHSALGKWLGSWLVGCTHHWLHHRKYTVHYSLYFTFWDRWLGTHYEGYENFFSPAAMPAPISANLPANLPANLSANLKTGSSFAPKAIQARGQDTTASVAVSVETATVDLAAADKTS